MNINIKIPNLAAVIGIMAPAVLAEKEHRPLPVGAPPQLVELLPEPKFLIPLLGAAPASQAPESERRAPPPAGPSDPAAPNENEPKERRNAEIDEEKGSSDQPDRGRQPRRNRNQRTPTEREQEEDPPPEQKPAPEESPEPERKAPPEESPEPERRPPSEENPAPEKKPAPAEEKSPPPNGENPEEKPAAPEQDAPGGIDEGERAVDQASSELKVRIDEKKLAVDEPDEAEALIDEIIGADSALSRAEQRRAAREHRTADRRREADREADSPNSTQHRREAAAFLRERLRGEPAAEPSALRRRAPDGDRLPPRPDRDRGRERQEDRREGRLDPHHHQPPYLHEGRRFVHFKSRHDVPAILLAAAVLDRVRVQSVREAPYLHEARAGRAEVPWAEIAPPPSEYQAPDAYVVSYQVDEKSLISRDDILFRQGSTQFADPASYELVLALAEAVSHPSLQNDRFVVEGHASAEGGYDANMELSQHRAERIVRDMVRQGVSPHRLIPVGYGESEARYPADAAEALRRQDRRVLVFRLGPSS